MEAVSWSLESYLGKENNTESVLPYTQITASFESGHVSGTGAAIAMEATTVTEGNNIKFRGTTSTLMFCYRKYFNSGIGIFHESAERCQVRNLLKLAEDVQRQWNRNSDLFRSTATSPEQNSMGDDYFQ